MRLTKAGDCQSKWWKVLSQLKKTLIHLSPHYSQLAVSNWNASSAGENCQMWQWWRVRSRDTSRQSSPLANKGLEYFKWLKVLALFVLSESYMPHMLNLQNLLCYFVKIKIFMVSFWAVKRLKTAVRVRMPWKIETTSFVAKTQSVHTNFYLSSLISLSNKFGEPGDMIVWLCLALSDFFLRMLQYSQI